MAGKHGVVTPASDEEPSKKRKIEDKEQDKSDYENENKDGSGEKEQDSSDDEKEQDAYSDQEDEEETTSKKEQKSKETIKVAELIMGKKQISSATSKPDTKRFNWNKDEPMPYAPLAHVFSQIETTTKRLEISAFLTDLLCHVLRQSPQSLLHVVYLCINRLCPDYEGLELGIGESTLMKAIAESTGRNMNQIKADYKKTGDLGLVAQNSRNTQPTMFKPKPLTVTGVFKSLKEIAQASGQQSLTKKIGTIRKLLAACQGNEAKFIIRSLEGKLRIGLAERTVLVSLAQAFVTINIETKKLKKSPEATAKDLEEGADTVKAVFSELPSYDIIIPALLEGGISGLRENCKLTPGIPLKPMLAKPTKAISEVLDRFEGKKFTCEYKYDGERAQVHYLSDGTIKVFSRNSEDMSVKYPDLLEQIPRAIKPDTKSFVLDAEAVAWDKEEKKLLPFQELSKRKRKDVKAEDIKVKVHLFAFDLLYLNGEQLIQKSLFERRQKLVEAFQPVQEEFAFAKSSDKETVEDIQEFLDTSVKEGCEGLMVKMLEGESATYEPSRRSLNWLKLKKDYLQGSGDSFDLVVIGAYYGRGKRTSIYGAFLLASYDPESETYQSICKLGTGFSEEALDQHFQVLKDLVCQEKKGYYDVGDAKADVWFEPKVVWEVLAADISLSPVYSAAKGLLGGTRGVSLRFPRFIRIRDDKDAEDATTPEQVAEAYQRQKLTAGGNAGGGKDDDFW